MAASPDPATAPDIGNIAQDPTTTSPTSTTTTTALASEAIPANSTTTATANTTASDPPPPPLSQPDNAQPVAPEQDVNPPDFQGEVATNNDLPSPDVIRKIQDYTVLDRNGKTHPFKSLYSGHNVARRVLVIFIRHFFCGNCQEYIRSLAPSITPATLLALPVSTFVVIIGCGAHELIDNYVKETGCPFDVYADPTRRLYDKLGMIRTLNMGSRPAYLQNKNVAQTVATGIMQGLKNIKTGLALKMGDSRQVGGEFLFEPASLSLDSPISSPHVEPIKNPLVEDEKDLMMNGSTNTKTNIGPGGTVDPYSDESDRKVEEKRVTWCHRMKTTRDHAEIPELMEVLGLTASSSNGTPSLKDEKRWSKALNSRKGTGLSLASQMNRMSIDANGPVAAAQRAEIEANGNGTHNGATAVKV